MNKRICTLFLAFLLLLSLVGCKKQPEVTVVPTAEDGEVFVFPENETDFGTLRTPRQSGERLYLQNLLPARPGRHRSALCGRHHALL